MYRGQYQTCPKAAETAKLDKPLISPEAQQKMREKLEDPAVSLSLCSLSQSPFFLQNQYFPSAKQP